MIPSSVATLFTGSTMQSVKFVMAKNSHCIYPHTIPIEGFADLQRPGVYKFNSTVVYEYLQQPHIPFELNYVEVLSALCDALSKLYDKFLNEDCYRSFIPIYLTASLIIYDSNPIVYETIIRLDGRVKHHCVNMIAKELTEAAYAKVKAEVNSLRSLSGLTLPPSNS